VVRLGLLPRRCLWGRLVVGNAARLAAGGPLFLRRPLGWSPDPPNLIGVKGAGVFPPRVSSSMAYRLAQGGVGRANDRLADRRDALRGLDSAFPGRALHSSACSVVAPRTPWGGAAGWWAAPASFFGVRGGVPAGGPPAFLALFLPGGGGAEVSRGCAGVTASGRWVTSPRPETG